MPGAPTSASSAVAAPRELLSGIDTLDLTCKVPAPAGLLADLAVLKAEAGEDTRRAVVFEVGDTPLRVAASGMGAWWPYRLEHRFGQLAVGESRNRPAWRVSPAAEALHVEGVARVVAFWCSIIEALTGGPVVLQPSRLDVHADFAGLNITEADRAAFVCRSGRQSVEVTHGNLETLYFGKGGDVTVRVYDKLAQVRASGEGAYLLARYEESGLAEGEQVQRVEAQLRRDALRSLHVMTAEDAISRCGEVYRYVVDKWLRLVDPSTATRRERAAADPRWTVVQAAQVAAGATAAQRANGERHAASLHNIVPMINGLLVSAGVALGVADAADVLRQVGALAAAYRQSNGRDFAAEVRARRLEFGPSVA